MPQPQPKVVAAILTAHHPSRWHYRQIARAQFLVDSPIPYKFVFGDAVHEGDWERTGLRDEEILHSPGSDMKTHLHLKNQAACRWALDQGASYLWRAMDDTWFWPDRLLKAGLESFSYAGLFPCKLQLGGVFKTPMRYFDFFHGGVGIWLSRKAMEMIVAATWREDYFAAWPKTLDIGFGLHLPTPDRLWDDFWLGEVLKGELAWDDPLRMQPVEVYGANGISIFEDDQLFTNDNPDRVLSIHDPGVVKKNDSRFDDLMQEVRNRNSMVVRTGHESKIEEPTNA
jgi:hypothetical protein